MLCTECGNETRVTHTRPRPDGSILRRRRCAQDGRHRSFATVERMNTFSSPTLVRKRDGRTEPFDLGKIRRSINKAMSNPTAPVPDSVVEGVLARVHAALAAGERELHSVYIGGIVLSELTNNSQVHAISRIRYALATLRNLPREGGFADLSDVKRWLESSWPNRESRPTRARPPVAKPVIVRDESSDEPWDQGKLVASIRTAMKGRGAAGEMQVLAERTAGRVRRALRHQTIVTNVQVSTEVMRALRDDPLIYLWYASVFKRFRTAGEVWKEMEDLELEGLPVMAQGDPQASESVRDQQ